MSAEKYFNKEQKETILSAIKEAETSTSGEIRVHIETSCKNSNVLNRAAHVFATLKMHKTALRNGVLFYLAINDRKFAIIGDAGINAVVSSDFWNNISEMMSNAFREGKFAEGLREGILMAGSQLKQNFPYNKTNDINELPDDISFGN
jgi:uncharacterized membrane protein